jgi:hypothetical protein
MGVCALFEGRLVEHPFQGVLGLCTDNRDVFAFLFPVAWGRTASMLLVFSFHALNCQAKSRASPAETSASIPLSTDVTLAGMLFAKRWYAAYTLKSPRYNPVHQPHRDRKKQLPGLSFLRSLPKQSIQPLGGKRPFQNPSASSCRWISCPKTGTPIDFRRLFSKPVSSTTTSFELPQPIQHTQTALIDLRECMVSILFRKQSLEFHEASSEYRLSPH